MGRRPLLLSLAAHAAVLAAVGATWRAGVPAEPDRLATHLAVAEPAQVAAPEPPPPPPALPRASAVDEPEFAFAEPAPPRFAMRVPPARVTTAMHAPSLVPVARLAHPLREEPVPTAVPPAPALAPARARPTKPATLVAPRPLPDASPAVRYPRRAERLGLRGTVVLRVHVTAEGAVARVEVLESSGHDVLDDAAAAAVRRWRFVPGRRGDKPVPATARLPVAFVAP